jgi:hypothetical protein
MYPTGNLTHSTFSHVPLSTKVSAKIVYTFVEEKEFILAEKESQTDASKLVFSISVSISLFN